MSSTRIAAAVLLLTALPACETTVAASDSTPPSLEYYYRLETEASATLITPDLVLDPDPDVLVYLVAVGQDLEGLKSIRIEGSGSFTCDGLPTSLTYNESVTGEAEVGEGTVSSRTVTVKVRLNKACGTEDPEGFINMWAYAENYHGGITSMKVKLRSEP